MPRISERLVEVARSDKEYESLKKNHESITVMLLIRSILRSLKAAKVHVTYFFIKAFGNQQS